MDDMLRTPADGTRLRILAWLGEPDTAERGLTADDVAARLGVPRPAALTHLRLLTSLGLLHPTGQDDTPRYRRDEIRLAEVTQLFEKGW
ncbi:helix-turn-helix domain-containing protein [Streptomyces lusitanus]|uniref:Helix-turn-helix domain-containing protein n=2 Tax=Streptomyces TaxID=1883 RepID=A0ABU3JKA1_9ACTN|nr:helix-turn-helix domain-containing protein [Streptomyces lusitanus]